MLRDPTVGTSGSAHLQLLIKSVRLPPGLRASFGSRMDGGCMRESGVEWRDTRERTELRESEIGGVHTRCRHYPLPARGGASAGAPPVLRRGSLSGLFSQPMCISCNGCMSRAAELEGLQQLSPA